MARKKAETAPVEVDVTATEIVAAELGADAVVSEEIIAPIEEVEDAVEDDFDVDIPVSDEEIVEGDDLEGEEFFQTSEIGEDEDEVTDDEISEDM